LATDVTWVPASSTFGPSSPTARYSNGAQVFLSQWDLTIEFMQSVPVGQSSGEPPSVVQTVVERVMMSPQHAKAFARLVQHHVDAYEKQWGELQIPPMEELQKTEEKPTEEKEATSDD
jgi:hypothetical protein